MFKQKKKKNWPTAGKKNALKLKYWMFHFNCRLKKIWTIKHLKYFTLCVKNVVFIKVCFWNKLREKNLHKHLSEHLRWRFIFYSSTSFISHRFTNDISLISNQSIFKSFKNSLRLILFFESCLLWLQTPRCRVSRVVSGFSAVAKAGKHTHAHWTCCGFGRSVNSQIPKGECGDATVPKLEERRDLFRGHAVPTRSTFPPSWQNLQRDQTTAH